ncbi:MAG: cytochrome c [Acidobacteriota bacterium]
MRTFAVLGLVVALVLCVTLLAAGDAAKGKELYMSKCATCHGNTGEGKAAIARMFKVEMKALSAKEVQDMKDDALKATMLKGVGKMKAVSISDKEAADVVEFMRTLPKK